MKNKKTALSLFSICILGLANAAYTLWHHVRLNTEGVVQQSFCDMGSGFNCDVAAFSSYARFFGLPTAAWGLMFYSVLLCLSLWMLFSIQDRKEKETNSALQLILVLSGLSLVPTFYLAGVSFMILKNVCLLCVFTYIINIALFGVSIKSHQADKDSKLFQSFTRPPTWTFVLAIVFIGFSAFSPAIVSNSINAPKLDANMLAQYKAAHRSSPLKTISLAESPFIGAEDAKDVLVEYSDFQCPFCARSSKTMPLLVKDYPKTLKLVYKHFPLDSSCNPHVQRSAHPMACFAAKSALCVFNEYGNQAYLQFKQSIFNQQSQISKKLIQDEALKSGFTEEKLKDCTDGVAIHEQLLKEINEAQAIGVQGTPAFFLNGRLAQGAQIPTVLRTLLSK